MPFTSTADTQGINAVINQTSGFVNLANYASLHGTTSGLTTSWPLVYSATGANELTGAGPSTAYARVGPLSWAAASGGSVALSSTPTAFQVPASYTVMFVGLWSVSSGGSGTTQFAGMGANGGAAMAAFTSTRHTDSPADTLTAPGVTYVSGVTAVVCWPGVGSPSLPSGLTAGQIYYTIGVSGASFQLSLTPTGSAVNLGSSLGSGLIQAITLESFGAPGTFQLSQDTLSIT